MGFECGFGTFWLVPLPKFRRDTRVSARLTICHDPTPKTSAKQECFITWEADHRTTRSVRRLSGFVLVGQSLPILLASPVGPRWPVWSRARHNGGEHSHTYGSVCSTGGVVLFQLVSAGGEKCEQVSIPFA